MGERNRWGRKKRVKWEKKWGRGFSELGERGAERDRWKIAERMKCGGGGERDARERGE